MNFKRFKLNASTLCAGGSMLVLSGFLAINLAGCGGGGGGGGSSSPKTVKSVNIRLLNSSGALVPVATLQLLLNGVTYNPVPNQSFGGNQFFAELPIGTYTASVDFDGDGPGGSITRQITIIRGTTQNYALVEGSTSNLVVSGLIQLNPRNSTGETNDPDNNPNTPNCSALPVAITAEVVVSIRDLSATGNPIIATVIRPTQGVTGDGSYSIEVPYRPTTFRAEVSRSVGSESPSPFAGYSATATFTPGENAITGLNICANDNGTAPVPPQATPIPGTTATPIITSTFTPEPTATNTPVTPTATATATNTPDPNATATSTPTATATTVAGG